MTTQTDTESVERQASWQDDFGDPGVAKFIRALAAERSESRRGDYRGGWSASPPASRNGEDD